MWVKFCKPPYREGDNDITPLDGVDPVNLVTSPGLPRSTFDRLANIRWPVPPSRYSGLLWITFRNGFRRTALNPSPTLFPILFHGSLVPCSGPLSNILFIISYLLKVGPFVVIPQKFGKLNDISYIILSLLRCYFSRLQNNVELVVARDLLMHRSEEISLNTKKKGNFGMKTSD